MEKWTHNLHNLKRKKRKNQLEFKNLTSWLDFFLPEKEKTQNKLKLKKRKRHTKSAQTKSGRLPSFPDFFKAKTLFFNSITLWQN